MIKGVAAFAIVIAFTAPVRACSGEGAGDLILINELKTWALSGIAAILIGASCLVDFVRRLSKGLDRALTRSLGPMALLVLCPPLWLSVRMGDCGFTAVMAGWAFVGLSAILLTWSIFKPLTSKTLVSKTLARTDK